MQSAAASMLQMQQQMASLFDQDQAMNSPFGSGALASFIQPMEINSQTAAQITMLPVADVGSHNEIWYVHTVEDYTEEGQGNTCTVHQVVKEHG